MANQQDHISMALFCDFENVALGVRDANYEKFDIKRVLERLLLKGSIVVKKAYCDWERYKGFKATMHEANFELIEIPHVRQSGKNSADIRLVVDALDLCYTKSHVNTFVIISGDSDFSPLVSKLRENAKHVIGVGVKQSTSDLLIANCDEFIFYDDLVREGERQAARREARNSPREGQAQPQQRRSPEEERRRREEMDIRRAKIIEMAVETYEALVTDRDEGGKIWASVLKEALKRRNPGFSESYYGFRTFGNLLEEAQARGMLEFGRDEKSGAYVFRGQGLVNKPEADSNGAALHEGQDLSSPAEDGQPLEAREPRAERTERQDRGERSERGGRNRGRGGRNRGGQDERRPAGQEPIDPVQAVAEHLMADGPDDFEPPADEPWYEPVSADELNIVVPEDTDERGDHEDSEDDDGGDQERSTNSRAESDRAPAARKTRGRRGRGGSRNTGNLGAEPSAPAAPAPAPTPAPTPVKAARTEPQAKENTGKPAGRANARPARKTSRAAAPAPEAPLATAEPTGGTSADTKPARKRAPRRTSKPDNE
jgi:uncharacterized LabA/DUF88 family protein